MNISALPFDPDAPAGAESGMYGLPFSPEQAGVIVIPVPFEATTSYGGGTSGGPAAVLEASRQVDLFDNDTGRPYENGIAMLPIDEQIVRWNAEARGLAAPVIAAGGETAGDPELEEARLRVNEISDGVNAWVEAATRDWLARDRFVAVLGGDHSVPFGAIRAHAERYPGMGILHLDAHADLREAYEGFTHSHASIFHNVITKIEGIGKLVQVGVRDLGSRERQMIDQSSGRIRTFYDSEVVARLDEGEPFGRIARGIVDELPQHVYLSWDIDGLDPTLCPGTGTPVPGGLSWNQAISLLRALVRSGRTIVGLDLCEVAPGESEWDANVGARLLYKMIGFSLLSREK